MKSTLSVFALATGLIVLAGCSSPQSRINQNPAIYAQLTPEQQQLIQAGKVGIGFDATMVKLALGEPDRISELTDASGTSEIWSYVTYEDADGLLLYRGYYHRYYYGRGDPFYPYYLAYPTRREHERFRVDFRDGKVVRIESEQR